MKSFTYSEEQSANFSCNKLTICTKHDLTFLNKTTKSSDISTDYAPAIYLGDFELMSRPGNRLH